MSDVPQLLSAALASELAAGEAFDAAIHIAMIEAVKEVSARWPRRRLHLLAGMGTCTIDVTGSTGGRPISWRFFWSQDEDWQLNDVRYTDSRPHQVPVGRTLSVQSPLIVEISRMNDEVHRDPIDYAPSFICTAGEITDA